MNKLIIILTIVILLGITIFLAKYSTKDSVENGEQEVLFQGPVPQGYDEDYYRHTGITKKEGENN